MTIVPAPLHPGFCDCIIAHLGDDWNELPGRVPDYGCGMFERTQCGSAAMRRAAPIRGVRRDSRARAL